MKNRHILLSPDLRTGNGLGHVVRCVAVASQSSDTYRLQIPEPPVGNSRGYEDLRSIAGIDSIEIEAEEAPDAPYDAIVYDRRSIAGSELAENCVTVGIDLGGSGRDYVDYLIDILPTPEGVVAPNTSLPHLLPAPKNQRAAPPWQINRVLLAFGGEDPAHLTSRVYRALQKARLADGREVTLVRGPANNDAFPEEATVLHRPPDLRELLSGFDLVVTSFGLTAFEALRAGCAVVTVDPSRYHHRLARLAGLSTAGVRRPDVRAIARAINSPQQACAAASAGRSGWTSRLTQEEPGNLHDVLSAVSTGGATRSPVTGRSRNRVVARYENRSFYRCRDTGLLFLRRFDRFSMDYGHDYFFSDYQKQYGRTYLDDFDHIRSLATPRLDRIHGLAPAGTVLDVGCAFGPFLDAARARGYHPFGLDISAEAASYVADQLGVPALAGGLLEISDDDFSVKFGARRFDVLTMWYVIEHFADLAAVLHRVNQLLTSGGVFAFSTPNVAGISGRKSLFRFLQNSPADHYTIWSPRTASAVLSRFGFRVKAVRVTGHHPERFGALVKRPDSFLGRLTGVASRIFRLGDTFEVYAVKTAEVENG